MRKRIAWDKVMLKLLSVLAVCTIMVLYVFSEQKVHADGDVCRIGETGYTGINAAINADHTGEDEQNFTTITLLKDVEEDIMILFDEKKGLLHLT